MDRRLLEMALLGWVALFIPTPAPAQEFPHSEPWELGVEGGDEIETDRDSFTPATTTAGCGWTIVEAAHSYLDNRAAPETHSFPELLIRQGMSDWLELRVGWNYEVGGAGAVTSGNVPGNSAEDAQLERAHRLLYGLKTRLTDQDAWLPQSALILQGFTPTGGEETDTHVSATCVFGWTLPDSWVFDTAVRFSTSSLEEDRFSVWAPSTVLKVPLGDRCKAHVEYFGVFTDGREDESLQHFFSPGAHYLITSDLEIGVRFGWGMNREAPNFFSNVGVGWRY